MSVFKAVTVIKAAEKRLQFQCEHPSIGEDCRRACMIGGMTVIGDVISSYKKIPEPPPGVKMTGRLGIIVSPFEDCPAGFEEIIIKGGRNKRVKICRLNEQTRKKSAPKGRPAYKGALRRRTRIYPSPGVIKRDIPGASRARG